MIGHGFTVWLTGLSGSGKTTLVRLLERRLKDLGQEVEVLDGDVVRHELSIDLGFSREDRDRHIRRIAWACELLNRHQVTALVAAISPYRAARDEVRARLRNFIEVYLDSPLEVLLERDPKGLYHRALAGEIQQFTGISDPYEPPLAPEVVCYTGDRETPSESATNWSPAPAGLSSLHPVPPG